jgi:hypothetical protein
MSVRQQIKAAFPNMYPPVGSRHMAGAAVVGIHTRRGAVVGMLRSSAAEDCSTVRDEWPSMM